MRATARATDDSNARIRLFARASLADARRRGEEAMTATAPTPVSSRRLAWIGIAIATLVALGIAIGVVASEWGSDGSTATSAMLVGSGTAVTEPRDVPAFDVVDLTGASNVTVRVGGTQSVVVSGDENLLDRVTTEVAGGTLAVGTKGSFRAATPLTVDVTVPSLDAVALTGSGELIVTGVDAGTFTAELGGSGTLFAAGTADRLDARLSGTGNLRLEDLVARDATAVLSGSGNLGVHATESLDASLPGVGEIVYAGNPAELRQEVTGTGVIRPE
jgi:hypothetical protein